MQAMTNISVVYVEQIFYFVGAFYKNDRNVHVNNAAQHGLVYCLTMTKSGIIPTLGWLQCIEFQLPCNRFIYRPYSAYTVGPICNTIIIIIIIIIYSRQYIYIHVYNVSIE